MSGPAQEREEEEFEEALVGRKRSSPEEDGIATQEDRLVICLRNAARTKKVRFDVHAVIFETLDSEDNDEEEDLFEFDISSPPTCDISEAALLASSSACSTFSSPVSCCSTSSTGSVRATTVETKTTDGPAPDTRGFDQLMVAFLEKRSIRTVEDIFLLFHGEALSLLPGVSRKCMSIIQQLRQCGKVGLLPSTVQLTPAVIPYLAYLEKMCTEAFKIAAERALLNVGLDECSISDLSMAFKCEGIAVF